MQIPVEEPPYGFIKQIKKIVINFSMILPMNEVVDESLSRFLQFILPDSNCVMDMNQLNYYPSLEMLFNNFEQKLITIYILFAQLDIDLWDNNTFINCDKLFITFDIEHGEEDWEEDWMNYLDAWLHHPMAGEHKRTLVVDDEHLFNEAHSFALMVVLYLI